MYNVTIGINYVDGEDAVDTAKRVRAEIKAAVDSGRLPRADYRVKTERFAGGVSIDVVIGSVPVVVVSRARIARDTLEPYAYHTEVLPLHSAAGRMLLDAVETILNSFRRDASDLASDYHNVSFYGGVRFSAEMERAQREAVERHVREAAERAAAVPPGLTEAEFARIRGIVLRDVAAATAL